MEISKHMLKMTYTSTVNTFNDFLPPPVDKLHPQVKSYIRDCGQYFVYANLRVRVHYLVFLNIT